MKVVINRKKYDTDTAECVACYSYAWPGDYNYVSEALYRKKTGEYFIYGEGGPLTEYGQSYGDNGIGYGDRIDPISEEDARKWAEEHLDGDEYEKIFGTVEE